MVYSELAAAVKAYLDRPDLPAADMNNMILGAEGDIARALVEHPRNITRGQFTQLADDPFLPLPVNLMQLIGVYCNGVPLQQFAANMREKAAALGGFIDKGGCYELFPTPVEDTLYRLDFYAQVPPLVPTESASTNWVLSFHPDVYLYGVLREAAIYLRDEQRLQAWGGEFARRLDALVGQGYAQNWSTPPRIRRL